MSDDVRTPKKEVVDKKPYINIKVNAQNKEDMLFRIRRTSKLQKLMATYCEKQSMELKSVVFLLDGHIIRADQTPDEVEMEDDSEIDAMLHMLAGSSTVSDWLR